MNPTITVGIPTFNRMKNWQRGFPSVSLLMQTDLDFELLVCDDGSTDGTSTCLPILLSDSPFTNIRVFKTNPKEREGRDSILADNVMIREARGDIFIHLDDDGYVTRHMIERVRQFMHNPDSVLWGEIAFMNADAPTVKIRDDERLRREGIKDDAVVRLSPGMLSDWGALWAAPVSVLQGMGGHDMAHYGYRGADARLGRRLSQMLRAYYVSQDWFTFFHLGETQLTQTRKDGQWREFLNVHRLPSQLRKEDQPLVANGGMDYWASKELGDSYRLVWEKNAIALSHTGLFQLGGLSQTGRLFEGLFSHLRIARRGMSPDTRFLGLTRIFPR